MAEPLLFLEEESAFLVAIIVEDAILRRGVEGFFVPSEAFLLRLIVETIGGFLRPEELLRMLIASRRIEEMRFLVMDSRGSSAVEDFEAKLMGTAGSA